MLEYETRQPPRPRGPGSVVLDVYVALTVVYYGALWVLRGAGIDSDTGTWLFIGFLGAVAVGIVWAGIALLNGKRLGLVTVTWLALLIPAFAMFCIGLSNHV